MEEEIKDELTEGLSTENGEAENRSDVVEGEIEDIMIADEEPTPEEEAEMKKMDESSEDTAKETA